MHFHLLTMDVIINNAKKTLKSKINKVQATYGDLSNQLDVTFDLIEVVKINLIRTTYKTVETYRFVVKNDFIANGTSGEVFHVKLIEPESPHNKMGC